MGALTFGCMHAGMYAHVHACVYASLVDAFM